MATMDGERVFVDTNVLVYAAIPQSPFCLKARSALLALERRRCSVWISRQIIREFLASMSRMKDLDWQPEDLFAGARRLEQHYFVAEEHPLVSEQLYLLLGQVPCGGKQVHDANIVATMLAYDVRQLLTHNLDDFRRFSSFIQVGAEL